MGVQHNGAAMGGGGLRGGGRGGGGGARAEGGRRGAPGAVARAAPGARGAPGPAARWRGGALGARCRRGPRPAAGAPQALPLRLPAGRATLPLLPASRPRTRLPYTVCWRAHLSMSR